ncbi:hypothetical protein FOMA001_g13897 [Fusarium oxysporum f. sp. matthiolae]|nr:hypothetical protein FOMA001_g13897 [Fusarium oxysporum f. sp. matthiolae]
MARSVSEHNSNGLLIHDFTISYNYQACFFCVLRANFNVIAHRLITIK